MKQIIVTADKPGRAVEIHTQIDDERRLIALMIQPNLPADLWIWLGSSRGATGRRGADRRRRRARVRVTAPFL